MWHGSELFVQCLRVESAVPCLTFCSCRYLNRALESENDYAEGPFLATASWKMVLNSEARRVVAVDCIRASIAAVLRTNMWRHETAASLTLISARAFQGMLKE